MNSVNPLSSVYTGKGESQSCTWSIEMGQYDCTLGSNCPFEVHRLYLEWGITYPHYFVVKLMRTVDR
jgi:hypothetical protein